MVNSLDEFKGTLPYASEQMGVYQPLLGWKARQTENIVDMEIVRSVKEVYDKVFSVGMAAISIDGEIDTNLDNNMKSFIQRSSLPFMNEKILKAAQIDLQNFVTEKGRSPKGVEIKSIFDREETNSIIENELKLANKERASDDFKDAKRIQGTDFFLMKKNNRQNSSYEATAAAASAATLKLVSLGMTGENVQRLLALNGSENPKSSQFPFVDPLADFDSGTIQAVLSPVGLIHIYRQYFYEFDTFLGSPVGHVWISPGRSVELLEVNSRRKVTERYTEISVESLTKSEQTLTEQEDLSEAVKTDNENNMDLGVTANGGAATPFYHQCKIQFHNAN
jgi:hypothetical protein